MREAVSTLESRITSENAPITKGLKGTRVPRLGGLHLQLGQFVAAVGDEGAIYLHAAHLQSRLA